MRGSIAGTFCGLTSRETAGRPSQAPLQQGILGIGLKMMLKYAFHLGPARYRLHRIAEKVADHSNIAGVR